MDASDQSRKDAIKRARDATRSIPCHTFLVKNWVEKCKEFDEESTRQILIMMHRALECAERSVKMRQTKRRTEELKASDFASDSFGNSTSESDHDTPSIRYAYNNL